MAATLCTHFKGNTYYTYYANGYILRSDQTVDDKSLELYLSCRDCAVITPNLDNRIPGALKALVKLVGYIILRPFAALVTLAIPTNIDSIQHPTLARIGRKWSIPSNFWRLEWNYFMGYLFFGNSGKARIIFARAFESILRKYTHADHAREIPEVFPAPFPNCEEVSLEDREKNRLRILRERCWYSNFRAFRFQDLIKQGHLNLSASQPMA